MLIYLILAPLPHISTICEEAWPLFNEALGLVIISQLTNHLSWLLVPRLNESLEVVIISQLTNHLSWLLFRSTPLYVGFAATAMHKQ